MTKQYLIELRTPQLGTQVYVCRLPAGVANINLEPGFEDYSDTHQGECYLQLNEQ